MNENYCDQDIVTEPRRWPIHPAPIDGETFYSWLRRIAACYGTDLTLLGEDLGFTLRWSAPEDIDAAAMSGMIDVLAERTGVTPDRLRQMGMAGWVPWRRDKSVEVQQQSEQRPCRFPGCVRPAVSADSGAGRPPGYCDDEGHNRAAAWRARCRLADELSRNAPDEKRPVDAARQRAGELHRQVAGMVEHLGQQLTALVEELRTVADPDAAEAQIESVTTEAAAQVAAASARASRAEQAGRQAEAERVEADAAATQASELAEQQQVSLAAAQQELSDRAHVLDQVTAELVAVRAAAEAQNAQALEQLATIRTRLRDAERDRDDVTAHAAAASAGRAEAEERARGAGTRADDEASRAQRGETDLAKIRDQLDQALTAHDTIREEANSLRGNLATAIVERDAARAHARRERTHGEQRISDLRTTQDQHLTQLRDELAELRQEVREQRSRPDRAEAHPAAPTDAAAAKLAT